MPPAQYLGAQLGIHPALLNLIAHAGEIRAPVSRVVNELLIVQHRVDRVVELVFFQKLIVIEEWNREARRNSETRKPGMN